jgi:ADP-heptose:LPS heptosyltransferase
LLVVTGPAEEERADELRAALAAKADAWLERPRLSLLAAVLAQSAAYLGNDSGASHLAAAAGAPVVAVFGPTDPMLWAPRGARARVLRARSGGLGDVTPREAISALRDVMASRPTGGEGCD